MPFGMRAVANGAWVYGARGLTREVIPETGLIIGVAAYPPCTVENYRRLLHH
ncbi:MAG TPA: hypothetical protein VMI72_17310 [Roseiarcus sp.]|nr:hypothetical protein [Roseiarcus sp.]